MSVEASVPSDKSPPPPVGPIQSTSAPPDISSDNNGSSTAAIGIEDNLAWNFDPLETGGEDKNPFSEFTEEHFSKLDEVLSCEEVKEILQQTNTSDFEDPYNILEKQALAENAPICNPSVDEPVTFESTFSDHAYAIPTVSPTKQKSALKNDTSPQLLAKNLNTNIDSHSMETTSLIFEEPPVLTKIELKYTGNEISTSTDDLPPDEDALQKPVAQDALQKPVAQDALQKPVAQDLEPQIQKIEVTPPKPSRRSSRISDQEQREKSERIRRENVQKEKEAMEEQKSVELKEQLKKQQEDMQAKRDQAGIEGKKPGKVTTPKGRGRGRGAKKAAASSAEDDDAPLKQLTKDTEPKKKRGKAKSAADDADSENSKFEDAEGDKSEGSTSVAETTPVKGKKTVTRAQKKAVTSPVETTPDKPKRVQRKKQAPDTDDTGALPDIVSNEKQLETIKEDVAEAKSESPEIPIKKEEEKKRKKHRKLDSEIPLDQSMTDLFKPDNVVQHETPAKKVTDEKVEKEAIVSPIKEISYLDYMKELETVEEKTSAEKAKEKEKAVVENERPIRTRPQRVNLFDTLAAEQVEMTADKESAPPTLQEDQDDGNDIAYEDDKTDENWEPDNRKWCICKQPHNNRFMICCDKCDHWFHGTCMGITKEKGAEMEENHEPFICPLCVEKRKMLEKWKMEFSSSKEEAAAKAARMKSRSISSSQLPGRDPEQKHHEMKEHKRRVSDGHPHPAVMRQGEKTPEDVKKRKHSDETRPNVHEESTEKKKFTNFKGQDMEKRTFTRCIVSHCTKEARPSSVYCSNECITFYVQETLKIMQNERNKAAATGQRPPMEKRPDPRTASKVFMMERKTGRLIADHMAPTESTLQDWLQKHPTFEVLRPSMKPSHFYSKDKKPIGVKKEEHVERNLHKTPVKVEPHPKSSVKVESHVHGKTSVKVEGHRVKTPSTGEGKEHGKQIREHNKTPAKSEKTHTKEPPKEPEKKADDGPDPVRISIRTSLRDILAFRARDADDVMLSNNEIKQLALSIEEELFSCFQDTNARYKAKYRSLIFNIKDQKNKGLFRKILNGKIKPYQLVRMTADELASKELAKWREMETKNTLDMIEMTEEAASKVAGTIKLVKKTHKGDIEVDDSDMSTLELHSIVTEQPKTDAKPDEDEDAPVIVDTTDKHNLHLFDLNCKICTGKVAPVTVEAPPPKKVKISHSISSDGSEAPKEDMRSETSRIGEEVAKEVLKVIEKVRAESSSAALAALENSQGVTISSPDSALQSGLEVTSKLTPTTAAIWRGSVHMQELARFYTSAYCVSGPTTALELQEHIMVCGRIAPEQVWDYLAKIKQAGSKDIMVFRFQPGNNEDKAAYVQLYSYLNSRGRCGVVGNNNKQTKDLYIVPLASHSKIPAVLLPFDGPGLDDNRPHILLGIIVKQKSKHSLDNMPTTSKQKEKSQYDTPPGKLSKTGGFKEKYVPQRRKSSVDSDKSYTPPLLQPHKSKRDPRNREKSYTPPGRPAPVIVPPLEHVDPIVNIYGQEDADLAATETVESSPYSPKDTDEDDPYVPGDPGSYSKPSSIAISVTAPSTKLSMVANLATQGGISTEVTAAMLAAITTNPKVSEQKRLLFELTKKVELQKKLLEQRKQQNMQELAPLMVGKEAASLLGNVPKAMTFVAKEVVNYPLPPVERQPTPPPLPTTSMPSTTTTGPLPPVSESSAVSSVVTTGVTTETDIVALTRNLVSGKEQAPTSVLPKTIISSMMSASDSAAVAMTLSLVAGDDKSKSSQLPSPLKSLFASMSQKQSSSVAGATPISSASPMASQHINMSISGQQQTMISPLSGMTTTTTATVSSTTLFQPPGASLLQPTALFPPPVPANATQPLVTKPEDTTIMENLKLFTSDGGVPSSTDTFKPPVRKAPERSDSPVFEVVAPKSRKTDGKAQIQIKFASLSGTTDAPLQSSPNVVAKSDSNVIPMTSPDSTQAADIKEGDKRKSGNIESKRKSKGPEKTYQDNLPKIPGFGSDDEVGSSALSFLRKPWEMPTNSEIEEKQNITSLFDSTNATEQPKSDADVKVSESADVTDDLDGLASGFGDIDERVIPVQHQQDIDYRQQPQLMHQSIPIMPAFQQADSTLSPEGDSSSRKFTQDVDHRRLPPGVVQHEGPRSMNPNAPFLAAPRIQHIIGGPRPPRIIQPPRAPLLAPPGNLRPPMMSRFPPDQQRPRAPLRGRIPMPEQSRIPLHPQMVRGPLIRGQPPHPEWRPPPRPEMGPEFHSPPMMPRPPFPGPILDSSRHPIPMEPQKPMDQDMRAAPSGVEGFPAPQLHPRPQFVPGLVRPDPPHNAENPGAVFLGDIDERVRAPSPKSDSTGSPLIDEPLMNVSQVHPDSQKDESQKDTTNTSSESGPISNITVVSTSAFTTVPSILDVKSAHEALVDDPLGSVEVVCSRDLSARLAKQLRENNEPKKEEKDRKRTHSREDSSTPDKRPLDDANADDSSYKRRRSEDRYSRQDSDRHRNRSRNSPSRHRNSPSRRRDSYRDDLRSRSDSDRDRRRSDRRSDERDRSGRDRHYDDGDRRSDDRDRRSDDRRSSRSDSDSRRRGHRS